MGLEVSFGTVEGKGKLASWRVSVDHLLQDGKPQVVLYGFVRRSDAEIAARVLHNTGIDWNATLDVLSGQYKEYGGRKALWKVACENLQW